MSGKFRLVMLGRLGVGKSALTVKYLAQRFITDYNPYTDARYSKIDVVNDEPVILKIWDTYTSSKTGIDMEKYQKWADGFLVVYSVTDRTSLLEAQAYIKHMRLQCEDRDTELKPIILVGNKCELELDRQISHAEGKKVADRLGVLFHECSAAGSVEAVEAAFHGLVRLIQRRRELASPAAASSQSETITRSGSLPRALMTRKSTSPVVMKKSYSTLKLFSKSFKIFT